MVLISFLKGVKGPHLKSRGILNCTYLKVTEWTFGFNPEHFQASTREQEYYVAKQLTLWYVYEFKKELVNIRVCLGQIP